MKCLIAINFHAFHDMKRLDACLESLIISINALDMNANHQIDTVLFNNSYKDLSHFSDYKKNLINFRIIQLDVGASGAGLNQQIEYAISHDYDIFFRVDADDVIYENRFSLQIEMLKQDPSVDVCGGGLDYYNLNTSDTYSVLPNQNPTNWDFLINSYCLHPVFAIRVASFKNGLRYWEKRVEDKRFILDGKTQGLKFENVQEVVGRYYLENKTRNTTKFSWLLLKLNLSWCFRFKPSFIIFALAIFIIRCFINISLLRKLRNLVN